MEFRKYNSWLHLPIRSATIFRMAKKQPRKKPPKEEPMIPVAEPAQAGDRHKDRQSVRLSGRLYLALKDLAKKNRRPLRWEVIAALEDHLRTAGMWPPPESD